MFKPQLFQTVCGNASEQSEQHIVYRDIQKDERKEVAIYAVLPGIEVAWFDYRVSQVAQRRTEVCADAVELQHCREGRAEFTMMDGCVQFQGEGDLFISTKENHSECIELPLGVYRGVAMTMDWCVALSALQEQLPGLAGQLPLLMERFLGNDECFMIQANEEVQALFAGMYMAPSALRHSYAYLKVLETILYLSCFDVKSEEQKGLYARQQVDVIKQIQKKITADLSQRYTIEALAREFCISPTSLKEHFRGIYGQSIAAYMKTIRMRKASKLLGQSTYSIGEIARMVGYESQSKFGAAFKEEMHVAPSSYRNNGGVSDCKERDQ